MKKISQKQLAAKLLSEIKNTVKKLAAEDPGILNLKIAEAVIKDLRHSFRIFKKFNNTKKITIFGSARTPKNHPCYTLAYSFARAASAKKYMIITGGGPGIMAAGNAGAAKSSFGLSIRLPFERHANEFVEQSDTMIRYKYFFIRKLFLVKEADACVFFPGGFGTFDEVFEVLTLVQTGKAKLIPLIFMDEPGKNFWQPLFNYLQKSVEKNGYISPDDRNLYTHATSPSEALKHIEKFYGNYHSLRFNRDNLFIRMKRAPNVKQLRDINKKFGHLSADGVWTVQKAHESERNEPKISRLPRLHCRFDGKSFGSLRALIDCINTF